MTNPQSGIENHPDGTGNLNAVINGNWANIVEWFNVAAGVTISQATTTATASAAVFTADMVGATIRFASGAVATITAYTSPTVVTVSPSQTVSPTQAANIYRTDQIFKTALARGLMKRHRFVTADDGQHIYWDQALLKFVFSFGGTFKQGTLTYAASVALDFDSNAMQTVALTGNITFTTSNKAAGRRKIVRIVADGSGRNFTWPSWTWVGGTAPASIAASKSALLSLDCFGTAEGDVVARYSVQS